MKKKEKQSQSAPRNLKFNLIFQTAIQKKKKKKEKEKNHVNWLKRNPRYIALPNDKDAFGFPFGSILENHNEVILSFV